MGVEKEITRGLTKKRYSEYKAFHVFMRSRFGRPKPCEHCGLKKTPKSWKHKMDFFNWSMKHGTWSTNRKAWLKLCRDCHRKYDYEVTTAKTVAKNIGKKRSRITRLQQSISGVKGWKVRRTWFVMSNEQKKKIGDSGRGIKRSKLTLKRMSIAQKKRWRVHGRKK